MKGKTINISSETVEEKIEVICRILSITAKPEMFVLKTLYAINSGNATPLDHYNKNLLCLKEKLNISTFNVSLSRLMKKGLITKAGSHYVLHEVFKGVHESEALIIKW